MVKSTVMEFTGGLITLNFKVSMKTISSTALENLRIQMEKHLKVNGYMAKDKAKELS
mgnify:CR=1 FL=1